MPKNVKTRRAGSRVSSKHQITIPKLAFEAAGLEVGDDLAVESAGNGRVVLTKIQALMDEYSGSLSTGGDLGEQIRALRDEWT